MRKLIVLALVSYLLIGCQSYQKREAQKNQSYDSKEELIQWINYKIDSVVKENDIPALSIGVIDNGVIIMKKGIGVLNRNTKQPTAENTIYQIASDTKKMTGVIAKNLANENKLELDKPIVDYLENLLDDGGKENLKNITLRHLLLHKSGLPYRQPTMTRKDGEPMLIPYSEDLLLNDLNTVKLESEPGTEFNYSNFGYAVAGYICKLTSGKEYSELINEYISQEYNMSNTTTILTDKQKEYLATPYLKNDRNEETSAFNMGQLSSAGGVYSTVNDLAKFMMLQIDAYSRKNEQSNPLILHENLYEKENGYGFGLGKKVFESGIQYGHGGDLDGFASAYVFSPQYKSGVIILTSSGGRWVGSLEDEIFSKLTNQKYIPPKKSIALAFYNLLSDSTFEKSIKWFEENKNSDKYYLKEEEMNNVGYALLQQNKLNVALNVFKYNTELFPNSANVYDSLGEYYLKIGNKKLALNNYKKSLMLNPKNTNAERQIEKIEADNID